jgi:hypothetical protein
MLKTKIFPTEAVQEIHALLDKYPKAAPILRKAAEERRIRGLAFLAPPEKYDWWSTDFNDLSQACGCIIGQIAIAAIPEKLESVNGFRWNHIVAEFADELRSTHRGFKFEHYTSGQAASCAELVEIVRDWEAKHV